MFFLAKLFLGFFDKITQDKIFKFIKTVLNNKINTFLDVGSHHGEYIINIKKTFQVKKIFGLEPSPQNYTILKKNIQNLYNVKVFNYGAGEENGIAILNQNIESSSSSINKLNENSKYFRKKYFFLNFFKKKNIISPVEIKIISLDNLLIDQDINTVDLLKIDTEGFELNVLKGLKKKISKVKLIHLEHHFDDMVVKNYKLSDIHNYLVKNNFIKVFKIKMKFRKSFEYIYQNKTTINK